jgi:hypothetical protein
MTGWYNPQRPQAQTLDELRRWVQSEFDRISIAMTQNEVIYGAVDPTTGVSAAIGTLYSRTTNGALYSKTGAADTAWTAR